MNESKKESRKRWLSTDTGKASRREANRRYRRSVKKTHEKDCKCSMCLHRKYNPECECNHCQAYYEKFEQNLPKTNK